jgi:hypothetical protein
MALTPTETSLCNKMMGDYAGIMAPVKAAKGGITSQRDSLLSTLGGTAYSPPSTLTDQLTAFQNAVGTAIPDPTDINSLRRMLQDCDYFNNLGPTAALAGTLSSCLSDIDSKINNFGASTGEFNAAKIASAMNQALSNLIPGGSALTDLIKKASQLIECLSTVCATGDPEYIGGLESMTGDFNDTLSGMGLVDDPLSSHFGEMDYPAIYSQVGMTTPEIDAINMTTATLDEQKIRAQTAVNDSITSVKSYLASSIEGIF